MAQAVAAPPLRRATAGPIKRAMLEPDSLVEMRVAVKAARRDGLVRSEWRAGQPAPEPVISNASPPYILVVSARSESISAPTDLSCWTGAAMRLHRVVERNFALPRPPSRP